MIAFVLCWFGMHRLVHDRGLGGFAKVHCARCNEEFAQHRDTGVLLPWSEMQPVFRRWKFDV